MDLYKHMITMIRPHWRRMLLAMLCMSVVAGCTSISAYLIKPVLDDITVEEKPMTEVEIETTAEDSGALKKVKEMLNRTAER